MKQKKVTEAPFERPGNCGLRGLLSSSHTSRGLSGSTFSIDKSGRIAYIGLRGIEAIKEAQPAVLGWVHISKDHSLELPRQAIYDPLTVITSALFTSHGLE